MAKAAPAPEVEADEAPAKPKRKRWPMLVGIVAALAVAGGGAGFYLTRGHGGTEKPEPAPEHPPIYVPLEAFTVNLQPEAGDQFLQVNMSLKVADEATVEAVKLRMPEVRNRLLLLLSSKKASELISAEGKENLSQEISLQVGHIVAPDKVPLVPIHSTGPAPATPAAASAEAAPVPSGAPAVAPAEAAPVASAAPALPMPIGTATAAPVTAQGNPVSAPTVPAGATAPVTTAAAPNPAPAGEAKPAAEKGPIEGVLFTSFIIQ